MCVCACVCGGDCCTHALARSCVRLSLSTCAAFIARGETDPRHRGWQNEAVPNVSAEGDSKSRGGPVLVVLFRDER